MASSSPRRWPPEGLRALALGSGIASSLVVRGSSSPRGGFAEHPGAHGALARVLTELRTAVLALFGIPKVGPYSVCPSSLNREVVGSSRAASAYCTHSFVKSGLRPTASYILLARGLVDRSLPTMGSRGHSPRHTVLLGRSPLHRILLRFVVEFPLHQSL